MFGQFQKVAFFRLVSVIKVHHILTMYKFKTEMCGTTD